MQRLPDRPVPIVVLLLVTGVALVLNPLYLDRLLPYPTAGDGFDLTGLYHAAFSTCGFLALGVGVDTLHTDDRLSAERALGVAAVAVVAFALWNGLSNRLFVDVLRVPALSSWRSFVNPLGYPGGETVLVESFVALGFPLGVALRDGDGRGVLLVGGAFLLAFLVDLLLGFVGAVRGIFGLFLLVSSSDLLGVPMLGAAFVVAAFLLGFGHRTLLRSA